MAMILSLFMGIGLGMTAASLVPQILFALGFIETDKFGFIVGNSVTCLSIATLAWLSHKERDIAFERKMFGLYRLAEFGRLSSGVFHDLINPLTAIALTVEKLKEDGNLPNTDVTEQIERAIRASKRMESFMHTARKHLKTQYYACSFSINREIEDATHLLQYKTRAADIEIKLDMRETYELYGNPVRFFQMMVNLMSNAIDSYTDMDKGMAKRHVVLVKTIQKERFIEISVKDRGCGMPRNVQSRIFTPFYTTKPERDGLGLGLSMTKRIAEKDFKGKISVESKSGDGSIFTVILPIRKPQRVPSAGIEPTSAR